MHRRSAALGLLDPIRTVRELECDKWMGSSDWIGHAGFPSTFEADSASSPKEAAFSRRKRVLGVREFST